jgi:hypothetical protein
VKRLNGPDMVWEVRWTDCKVRIESLRIVKDLAEWEMPGINRCKRRFEGSRDENLAACHSVIQLDDGLSLSMLSANAEGVKSKAARLVAMGMLKFAPSALQSCKYRSSSYFVIQDDDHTDRHDCHVDHDE